MSRRAFLSRGGPGRCAGRVLTFGDTQVVAEAEQRYAPLPPATSFVFVHLDELGDKETRRVGERLGALPNAVVPLADVKALSAKSF